MRKARGNSKRDGQDWKNIWGETKKNSFREANQELKGIQGRCRTQNRDMIVQKKLAFIWVCCEHIKKYKP